MLMRSCAVATSGLRLRWHARLDGSIRDVMVVRDHSVVAVVALYSAERSEQGLDVAHKIEKLLFFAHIQDISLNSSLPVVSMSIIQIPMNNANT